MSRDVTKSMLRGFAKKCPACGEGKLYSGFLRVADSCPSCGEDLSHQRADDAPPYFTIMIIGHIVVPAMWVVERVWQPDMWLQMALWPTTILILALWLLPRVKGAIVGLQWGARMHGFGGASEAPPAFDVSKKASSS
ncbi:MAG: DUF983 domain-containing protein [Alphaproteobacteria bacterium]|nr:DUF983 domain-containing protein [Alphaproteobacteria bacterium]